jgi:diaminopimelate epimerase
MDIKAFKMDGLGNDFVIIDRRKNEINLSKEQIIKIGDRNNVGFDQIIFIEKEVEDVFPIKIYNPDGIEVGACGNGSRCIAYLISKENNQKNIKLEADKRILEAEILGEKKVKVNMGFTKFKESKDIPLIEGMDPRKVSIDFLEKEYGFGYCVNVGNPHIVFFVKDCEKIDIEKIGPKIENHHYFPERVNVTFAEVADDGNDRKNIKVNVWERGAGKTKACGTAACATVVVGYLNGLTERICNVHFKEGSLEIFSDMGDCHVYMTGPVSDIKEITLKI